MSDGNGAVKRHRSMEAAWAYMLHLEDEAAKKANGENLNSEKEKDATADAEEVPPDDAEDLGRPPLRQQLLHMNDGAKLVICMVGKPARGKTFLAFKIRRYLEWLGYKVKHIEKSQVRREMFGSVKPEQFFDPHNEKVIEQKNQAEETSLQTAVEWLQGGGQVVIYDGMNLTRERRERVSKYIGDNLVKQTEIDSVIPFQVLFVESFCDDLERVKKNFLELRKLSKEFSEYQGMSDSDASELFLEKLKYYDNKYEKISEEKEDISFIRLTDFGRSVFVHRIQGFIESKLVSFCMNIHTEPRIIILVRHGQSEYNLEDRIGGDPDLTEAGLEFSENLAKYLEKESSNGLQIPDVDEGEIGSESDLKKKANLYAFNPSEDLIIWTSNLKRTLRTVSTVKSRAKVPWVSLSEIDAGVCECMTYKEFREQLTTQYMKRQRNKAFWRYPGGESYVDVKMRLEPVIFELERVRKPVMVCAHRAVLRCLYSYFIGSPISDAPYLPFPLHTLLVLTPTSTGWTKTSHGVPPDVGDLGAHELDAENAKDGKKRKEAEDTVEDHAKRLKRQLN